MPVREYQPQMQRPSAEHAQPAKLRFYTGYAVERARGKSTLAALDFSASDLEVLVSGHLPVYSLLRILNTQTR